MLPVMRQELRNIGSASVQASLYFNLLGISLGIFGTAAASLATGEIMNAYTLAGFVAALIVSLLTTICFGVLAWLARSRHKEQIKTIEDECAAREADLIRVDR